jgi:ribonuclease VapC
VILDTSAILAILYDEPERDEFLDKIDDADQIGIGAPTLTETAIVLCGARDETGLKQLTAFVERANAVAVSFEAAHWRSAVEAWLRYGKGRHPAALNFGDCLAYATAQVAARPLLCKGDDLAKTDLALA